MNHLQELSLLSDNILLSELEKYGILNLSEIPEKLNMLKNKKVDYIHTKKIYTRKDGRLFTKVIENDKEKQINGKDEGELYCKLYNFYFGESYSSLEVLYPQWVKWREEESSVSKKTIKENMYLWNTFLKGTDITKPPLKYLKPKDFVKFFRKITRDGQMTRKRFNDMKSVINGIIYYAIEEEIIEHNYLRDINYGQFNFKSEDNNVMPFTETERLAIINHLDNDDIYSLAIKLDFYLILRIGELKGLKWEDVKGNFIYVHRFINDENEVIEDIKGHQKEGKRFIPLTANARTILERIKEINPKNDYLFTRNGKPLSTCTFNRHIRRCCKDLGIEYRSSHKVRFSTASIMYKNGVGAPELQKMLDHTTLAMTTHYLRSVTPEEDTLQKMNDVLG
ncbi:MULTISPECIES: tyrosine-type recombinase/integrase [unclassified Lacrimispora]|uniref:tyrosine-type recombinase/integrase n=1 Tax=unclassified Lacrimispora TaxID=2719232 RepID=UPI00376FA2AD